MASNIFLGVVTASKAVVSEVTDDKNQAVGINIIGAAWGIGFILGPAASAAVADPIGQYSLNITSKSLCDSACMGYQRKLHVLASKNVNSHTMKC